MFFPFQGGGRGFWFFPWGENYPRVFKNPQLGSVNGPWGFLFLIEKTGVFLKPFFFGGGGAPLLLRGDRDQFSISNFFVGGVRGGALNISTCFNPNFPKVYSFSKRIFFFLPNKTWGFFFS